MSLSRIAARTVTRSTREAVRHVAREGAEVASKRSRDTVVRQATRAVKQPAAKAAAAVMLQPPVLTKKAAGLLKGTGVTTTAAHEALAAGDLVFQQAVKAGLAQTAALEAAAKQIATKLGPAGAQAELVTALANGLRPATRAKLGKAGVTRTVKGAAGRVTPQPRKPVAVKPAPTTPGATQPVAVKPAPATPGATQPTPGPRGTTPAALRTLAADLTLLGTATYEAGRATRRAADATYRAGQATRAYLAAGGPTQSWQGAWARHDAAYQAMHRELAATGEAASRWVKGLATRVIAR